MTARHNLSLETLRALQDDGYQVDLETDSMVKQNADGEDMFIFLDNETMERWETTRAKK